MEWRQTQGDLTCMEGLLVVLPEEADVRGVARPDQSGRPKGSFPRSGLQECLPKLGLITVYVNPQGEPCFNNAGQARFSLLQPNDPNPAHPSSCIRCPPRAALWCLTESALTVALGWSVERRAQSLSLPGLLLRW